MKVGIFVTNQNPLGTDMVSALDEQFAMTRLARDRGWDAVGTGQHYLSEGMSQLQLSTRSSATASSSAARRNATSSSAHAGKRWARTSFSSARTGSACRWPTRWPACGS